MNMTRAGIVLIASALMLSACGKKPEEEAAGVAPAETPAVAQGMPPGQTAAPEAPAVIPKAEETAAAPPAPVAPPKPMINVNAAPLGKDEALALAQASGCLACHKIEAKLVGPAWSDVSAKYKGDAGARARLVAKVKAGGKGNWTEVTGGMPMPPYSPRVADESIEKLVTFVLSL